MRTRQSFVALVLAILLISCQSPPRVPVRPQPQSPIFESQSTPSGSTAVSTETAVQGTATTPGATAQKKSDAKTKPPIPPVIGTTQTGLLGSTTQEISIGAPPVGSKEKQRIVFNFDKADIGEVTSQIFGDQLKLNYVLDQSLQGRISMYIEGDFDSAELLQMVTRGYEANGISVIPRKGFYYIQSSQKAGGSGLPLATTTLLRSDKESRPLIVIYRLRFMDPKQASGLITPFLSAGKKVVPEPVTNSLIFIEDSDNARSLINLLKTIDINILQEISMEIVPLNSISPQDAVQGMESLMGKLGGFKESSIKSSLAFIPLQSFGGVLVMAQNPELLKSARQWLQALDIKGVGSTEEIYVYFVQNGLARDIADILNSVYGISSGGGISRKDQQIVPSGRTASRSAFGGSSFGSSSTGSSSSAFGRSSSYGTGGISGSSFGSSGSSRTASQQTSGGAGATGMAARSVGGLSQTGKPVNPIFSGEVMIIADEVNNAVVIRANAVDYAKVKKTLETLDILPRAVLIEVTIAEVQLNKEFEYGLQYWFQQHKDLSGFGLSFGGLTNSTTATTTSGSSASTSTISWPSLGTLAGNGVAMSWIAGAQNLAVFLNALSARTSVKVLSTPTLLATDNKDASITVGGREPVPTGSYATSSTTDTSGIFSTISYEETGVILNVTPHINAGGLVRLEVEQIIRRVGSTVTVGAGNSAPRFTERNVKTTLMAQSGSTVIIGGIIDSQQTTGKTGIPVLQNIPLISPLFSSTTDNFARTELIVAITPHVIDQRGTDAPKELLEKLRRLKIRTGQIQ
ncbi:MAG: type II secretion system secretin GspD [Desulfobacteraceae bacterium]|nr:type II secretion system secretin GspD [Desulfobacteraceae bacterium]